jgi:hypothetical protein
MVGSRDKVTRAAYIVECRSKCPSERATCFSPASSTWRNVSKSAASVARDCGVLGDTRKDGRSVDRFEIVECGSKATKLGGELRKSFGPSETDEQEEHIAN